MDSPVSACDFEILIDAAEASAIVVATHDESAGRPLPNAGFDPAEEKYKGLPEKALIRLVAYNFDGTTITLETGSTSYPQYRRTRSLKVPLEKRWLAIANPLSVCCVCRTGDGYLLVEERGDDVELYRNCFHVVGGYTERDLDRETNQPAGVVIPNFPGAIARELEEELGGIQPVPNTLRPIGLVYDCVYQHPELCFSAELKESLAEITETSQSTPEFNVVLEVYDRPEDLMSFLCTETSRIVPTGKAALLLYGHRTFGSDWFLEAQQGVARGT